MFSDFNDLDQYGPIENLTAQPQFDHSGKYSEDQLGLPL